MRFTGTGMVSSDLTVGLTQIKKPHNEKPVGKYSIGRLKTAVEMAESLGHEEVYLWQVPPLKGPEDGHALAITSEKDSDVGIAVAGRIEE